MVYLLVILLEIFITQMKYKLQLKYVNVYFLLD